MPQVSALPERLPMTKPSYKRSGGPQTPDGKLAVSKNALKSGAYSTALLLPGESEADFQELYESLLTELQAEGVLESTLVRDLAVLTWKRLRVEQIEHRLILSKLELPASPEELFESGLTRRSDFELALPHLERLKEENRNKFLGQKQVGEGLIDPKTRAVFVATIQQKSPNTYQRLVNWCNVRGDRELTSNIDIIRLSMAEKSAAATGDYAELIMLLGARLGERLLDEANALIYALDHIDQVRTAEQRVKDLRLSGLILAEAPSRAKDDLSRNFYRTLKELRTQQLWRRQNQVIDVIPSNE